MADVLSIPGRRRAEPAARRDPALHFHVLGAHERDAVEPIWLAVERAYGEGGLASSWVWTSTWLDHYGDIVPHRFVAAYDGDVPVGVALITRGHHVRRGPVQLRSVHVGTAGEPAGETVRVQYNRLLVSPAHRHAFAAAILQRAPSLLDGRSQLLILDGFCPDELAAFGTAGVDLRVTRAVSYAVDLADIRAAGRTVTEALRRNTTSKIRRSIKRLEEQYGPVRLEWAETADQAAGIYAEMCELHNARWRAEGRPGVFESARFDGFHRQIIERLLPHQQVLLARVKAGDLTVGCDYDFIERGRVLAYQWGVTHFEEGGISAGLVVGASVMQAALERGLNEYDWLAGDVLYKRMLSTTERELTWASRPLGPVVPVLDAAARVKRSLGETINRRRSELTAAA